MSTGEFVKTKAKRGS